MSDKFDPNKEREFLNGLVQDYTDSSPYSELKKEIIVQKMLAGITKANARGLQFGSANGYETNRLARHLGSLDVVDGSSIFIERIQREQQHTSNTHFHLALFEEFDVKRTGRTYDYVSCNYILEHVFRHSAHLGEYSWDAGTRWGGVHNRPQRFGTVTSACKGDGIA